MAREIKFRAWDGMHFVYSSFDNIGEDYLTDDRQERDGSHHIMYRNDIRSLCQFTGLHDKNGKEIYEGDVVRLNNTDCVSVEFEDGAYWFCYSKTDRFTYDWARQHEVKKPEKTMEIIGNIYENPELSKI